MGEENKEIKKKRKKKGEEKGNAITGSTDPTIAPQVLLRG